MKTPRTETAVLVTALRILERDIQSGDGVANAAIAEAADRLAELERENAALREALANADELERYSGSNGERQWGRCSAWLYRDDAVVIISAKALDAARKEAQP